eukprot:5445070-Prymnesium_polylepis.1
MSKRKPKTYGTQVTHSCTCTPLSRPCTLTPVCGVPSARGAWGAWLVRGRLHLHCSNEAEPEGPPGGADPRQGPPTEWT